MPLVVPGITDNSSGDKTQEWTNKLVGKKLCDEPSSETVSRPPLSEGLQIRLRLTFLGQVFCKTDLPQQTRVIEEGQMVTKDFNPDRLNVHLNKDGTVSHVNHG